MNTIYNLTSTKAFYLFYSYPVLANSYLSLYSGCSTGEGGRPTSHVNCKQTPMPEKAGAVSPPPVCLERGKHVAEAHAQENSE
jgi:hypothetical protein